jgi:hypothetical protein
MKFLSLIFAIVLFWCVPAFGQEKPISQSEYVKMLYGLQKSPGTKSEIVDALRRRGIDFVLTDGVRSLTRSKGANDEELKRALEEADRRRQNPTAAKLPTEIEITGIIDKTRRKTLAAVEEMPDFVVKQQIQRSAAYAGTGNFRNQDRLIVAVSYRSTGEEDYRLLSKDGVLQQNVQSKRSYEEAGGTSSTGEFVTMLATIFKPESDAEFTVVDTDVVRGRRSVVFDFSVARDKAKQQIISGGTYTESTITGMKGRIWIDREDYRVLKVESEATEIPEGFPIRTARRVIDYDWTTIADEKYLLPLVSDVRLTFREKSKIYETRNLIRFTNYQKYGTEVVVGADDIEPPKDEKP